jgi:hypothetical protein
MFPNQLTDDEMNGAVELSNSREYRAPCPGAQVRPIVVRATGMSRFVPSNIGTCAAYLGFFDAAGVRRATRGATVVVRIEPGSQMDLTAEIGEYPFCGLKCADDCNGDCRILFSDS